MTLFKALREMHRRTEAEDMVDTLKTIFEAKETCSRLDDEYNSIKQEYPKYKPKKVKAQYDKLKLDIIHCRDEIEVCRQLLLLGIPLDEFNRVYEQAKFEILDILSRYETDVVLNVLMAEHTLSAYIRYCRTTKELTYNVDLVYIDGGKLPKEKMTDDYLEVLLVNYNLIPHTLSELHNKWKKAEPVEANLHRNFRYGTRNHSTIAVPCILLRTMSYCLYEVGDLPTRVFLLPDELSKEDYNLIFGDDNLS